MQQKVLAACNSQHTFFVQQSFSRHLPKAAEPYIIAEPKGRNTAASIALAVLWALELDRPQSTLLVMPSDHFISDPQSFSDHVSKAVLLAQQGLVTLFGIKPERPEPGYGYIQHKNTQVLSFTEKPTPKKSSRVSKCRELFVEQWYFLFYGRNDGRKDAKTCARHMERS